MSKSSSIFNELLMFLILHAKVKLYAHRLCTVREIDLKHGLHRLITGATEQRFIIRSFT